VFFIPDSGRGNELIQRFLTNPTQPYNANPYIQKLAEGFVRGTFPSGESTLELAGGIWLI
jgi:hypothetical protein